MLRVVSVAWMTSDMLCGSAVSDGALLVFMLYAVDIIDIVCCAVSDIVCCRYALRVCCMLLLLAHAIATPAPARESRLKQS